MSSFEESKSEAASDSSKADKSSENKKLNFLLPVYNFVDLLLDIVPFIRNRIGSFLITKAWK